MLGNEKLFKNRNNFFICAMHDSITDKIIRQKKFNHSSWVTSIYPKQTKIYVAQDFCLIVFISAMNRAFLLVLYHKQRCSVNKKNVSTLWYTSSSACCAPSDPEPVICSNSSANKFTNQIMRLIIQTRIDNLSYTI